MMEKQFESGQGRLDKSNRKAETPGLESNTPESAATRTGFDPTGRYGEAEGKQDRALIPELNPAYLFNGRLGDDAASSIGTSFGRNSSLPSAVPDLRFAPKVVSPAAPGPGPDQSQRDFQTFWDSQKAPFGRIPDPINDPIDGTRSLVNPFAIKKPTPAAPTAAPADSGSDPFAFGSSLPASARTDFLSPGAGRGSAFPTYTSPAPAPASAPTFQAKPAILEIPRPRM
jgi:hypothetical protein